MVDVLTPYILDAWRKLYCEFSYICKKSSFVPKVYPSIIAADTLTPKVASKNSDKWSSS